jgi:hypothetical protein
MLPPTEVKQRCVMSISATEISAKLSTAVLPKILLLLDLLRHSHLRNRNLCKAFDCSSKDFSAPQNPKFSTTGPSIGKEIPRMEGRKALYQDSFTSRKAD